MVNGFANRREKVSHASVHCNAMRNALREDERRREMRVRLEVPITAKVRGRKHPFRLLDLSCTGAQIERGPDSLPPPLVHTLELDLGGDFPLRLLARTVWTTTRRHAVVFLAMDDMDRVTMGEVIDHLLERRERVPRTSGVFRKA